MLEQQEKRSSISVNSLYFSGMAFLIVVGLSFLLLMMVFRTRMALNIAISAAYVFGIFLIIYRKGRAASAG